MAGKNMTDCAYNSVVGYMSGSAAFSASSNVLLGAAAGQTLNGSENVFAGASSGSTASGINQSVGIGAFTLQEAATSVGMVAAGYMSGQRMLTGSYSTLVGNQAGQNARYADHCTMVGHQSGRAAFKVANNTYIGALAGYSNQGNDNVLTGYKAGLAMMSAQATTAVGAESMCYAAASISNVGIGHGVARWGGGQQNVFIGVDAAPTAVGSGNCVIAYAGAPSLNTGGCNVLIGVGADVYRPDTSYAVVIGAENVVGNQHSISIGENIGNTRMNSTLIGYLLNADADNSLILGSNIQIQSVVYFTDPLNVAYESVVAVDGASKFGISNIDYTDLFWADPTVATAGVPTSNLTTWLPISPPSFDLLGMVSTWALVPCATVPILSDADLGNADLMPIIRILHSSNIQPTVNSYPITPAMALSTSAFPVAVSYSSDTVMTNITERNSSGATYTVSMPKRANRPIHTWTTCNMPINTINNTIPHPKASMTTDSVTVPGTLTYTTAKRPAYGTLSSAAFTGNTSYMPYIEGYRAPSDKVELLTVFSINSQYGIPTSNTVSYTLAFEPALIHTEKIAMSNIYTLTTADILITHVATSNQDVRFTTTDGVSLIYGGVTYTSEELGNMVTSNIDAYSPALLSTCNMALLAMVDQAVTGASNTFAPLLSATGFQPVSALTSPTFSNLWTAANLHGSTADTFQSAYFDSGECTTMSNLFNLSNTVATALSSPISYGQLTEIDSIASIASIAAAASNLVHMYTEVPRLFLTYADLLSSGIQLAATSTTSGAALSATLINSNLTIPITWMDTDHTLDAPDSYRIQVPAGHAAAIALPFNTSGAIQSTQPSHGFLSSNTALTTNAKYQIYDPFADTDTIRLIQVDATNKSSLATTIEFPRIGAWSNAMLVSSVPAWALVTSNITVLDTVVDVQALSNLETWITSSSNLDGSVTASSSELYSPLQAYDPAIGLTYSTVNVSSNWWFDGTGSIMTVIQDTYTFGPTLVLLSSSKTVDVQADPALSSNTYLAITTSNMTSNAFAWATTTTQVIQIDEIVDHFTTTDHVWLYQTSNTTSTNQIYDTVTTAKSDTSAVISNRTERARMTSNVSQYDQAFLLTRPFYNADGVGSVVASNVGVVTGWTRAGIAADQIYVLPGLSHPIPLTVLTETEGGVTDADLILNFGTGLSVPLTDLLMDAPPAFTAVSITYVERGAVVVGTSMTMIVAATDLPTAQYLRTSAYAVDTIKYMYVNGTQAGPVHTRTIFISCGPTMVDVGINTGLDDRVSTPSTYLYYAALAGQQVALPALDVVQYSCDCFPSGQSRQTLEIATLGLSNTTVTSPLFDVLSNLQVRNGVSAVSLVITEQPTGGSIVAANNFAAADQIRFIPYEPMALSNQVFKMRAVFPSATTPEYTVDLKNWFAPFEPSTTIRLTESAGLVEDGYAWTVTQSNCTLANATGRVLTEQTFTVTPLAWTEQPRILTSAISCAVDQADSLDLGPLLRNAVQGASNFYVVQPPVYGIISTTNVYQHLGLHTNTDTIVFRASSSPYDLTDGTVTTTITVRPLPLVTTNRPDQVFFDTATAELSTVTPGVCRKMSINTSPYMIHAIQTSNIAMVDMQSGQPNVSVASSNAGFRMTRVADTASMTLVLNQSATVNPLATWPEYAGFLTIPWTTQVNQYINSNVITATLTEDQVLRYDLNNAASGYTLFTNHVITMEWLVEPYQAYEASNPGMAVARTYDFTVSFGQAIRFHSGLVTCRNVTVAAPLRFNQTNDIVLINQDPDNGGRASLYIGYDNSLSKKQNAAKNVWTAHTVAGLDLSQVQSIGIWTDLLAPDNFVPASNFTHQAQGKLPYEYQFLNAGTTLRFSDIQVSASTYEAVQSDANKATTYNVVLGKSIQVRGTDNICIGNNFSTSGANSIICGNDIGIDVGATAAGQVNNVYESIIIGNQSFQNSVVRDVISIGNNHMAGLSLLTDQTLVSAFLAQKPVLIGNNITSNMLDYHVNVDNVFLKTAVGGEQIYLGQGEPVGIGFASNVGLTNAAALHVVGGIDADFITTPADSWVCSDPTVTVGMVVSYDETHGRVVAATPAAPVSVGVVGRVLSGGSSITTTRRGIVFVVAPVLAGQLLTIAGWRPGFAQAQTDDVVHSYTIGKALENATVDGAIAFIHP